MKSVALFALTLFGCSSCAITYIPSNKNCVTRCGLILENTPKPTDGGYDTAQAYNSTEDYWTCENFQTAEDEILAGFEKLVDKSGPTTAAFASSCDMLTGVTVHVMPQLHYPAFGVEVYGATQCARAVVTVNNIPWHMSALTHELAHVIQDCTSQQPIDCEEPQTFKNSDPERFRACTGHGEWRTNGIDATVEYIRAVHAD